MRVSDAAVARASDAAANGGLNASDAGATAVTVTTSPVFVANRGKLVGAWSGFAWIAGADGVRIDAPNPCDARGCFRGTDGRLCANGWMPAPSCSLFARATGRCRPAAWAVKIGLDVRREGGGWGDGARGFVSIDFRGAPRARLAVHEAGDGDDEYCIDDYHSGDLVEPSRFRAACERGGGNALASFARVDKVMLELPAPDEAAPFDTCITAIHVGDASPAIDAGEAIDAPD